MGVSFKTGNIILFFGSWNGRVNSANLSMLFDGDVFWGFHVYVPSSLSFRTTIIILFLLVCLKGM